MRAQQRGINQSIAEGVIKKSFSKSVIKLSISKWVIMHSTRKKGFTEEMNRWKGVHKGRAIERRATLSVVVIQREQLMECYVVYRDCLKARPCQQYQLAVRLLVDLPVLHLTHRIHRLLAARRRWHPLLATYLASAQRECVANHLFSSIRTLKWGLCSDSVCTASLCVLVCMCTYDGRVSGYCVVVSVCVSVCVSMSERRGRVYVGACM